MPCHPLPVLSKNLSHDIACDVGQSKISAGVVVGELLVIEPHEGEQRGVQVVHVHPALDGELAELVGGAVAEAAFYAGAERGTSGSR